MSPTAREATGSDAPTREAILRAACVLFAEKGYTRASLSVVADGLGITRQAFYYHFKTKGDILAALFDRAMGLVESELEERMQADLGHRYLEMLSGHMQVVLDNVDLIKITMHERPSIDQLHIEAEKRRSAYARNFASAFKAGVDAGTIWPGQPGLVVQANLSMINGLCTWWKPGRPAASVVHTELLSLLKRGLIVNP